MDVKISLLFSKSIKDNKSCLIKCVANVIKFTKDTTNTDKKSTPNSQSSTSQPSNFHPRNEIRIIGNYGSKEIFVFSILCFVY